MFEYKDNFHKIQNVTFDELLSFDPGHQLEFTICIPTFKRDDLLVKAVASIKQQKKIINYEILIVDNDSDRKELPAFVKNDPTGIRYLKNTVNIGMFGNWNRCLLETRAKKFIILCDDDWLDGDYFSNIKSFLSSPKAIMGMHRFVDARQNVSCLRRLIPIVKKAIIKFIRPEVRNVYLLDYFFEPLSPLLIFEKEKALAIGGFNDEFFPASDVVFYSTYIKKHGGIYINKVMSFYRIQENESRKPEVALAFPEMNKKIRMAIASESKGLLRKIIPYSYAYERISITRVWNVEGVSFSLKDKIQSFIYVLIRVLREIVIIFKLWDYVCEYINSDRT